MRATPPTPHGRRSLLSATSAAALLLTTTAPLSPAPPIAPRALHFTPAAATDAEAGAAALETLAADEWALQYPSGWRPTEKPVKTHLSERLLNSDTRKGVSIGVTVDPIKISSLEAFGTPEEVAGRVPARELKHMYPVT